MCARCVHAERDCSHLEFERMTPIQKPTEDGVIVVKCIDYQNET